MCCHRHQRDEIPEHVRVLKMCFWVPFLSVDKVWKQNRVPEKAMLYTHLTNLLNFTNSLWHYLMKKIGVLFPTRSQFPSSV